MFCRKCDREVKRNEVCCRQCGTIKRRQQESLQFRRREADNRTLHLKGDSGTIPLSTFWASTMRSIVAFTYFEPHNFPRKSIDTAMYW